MQERNDAMSDESRAEAEESVAKAEEAREDADSRSFFTKPTAVNGVTNVRSMIQDDWKFHPRSLYNLFDDESGAKNFAGIFESFFYDKTGGKALFPMHSEQNSLPFTHYQASGQSFWILLLLNTPMLRYEFKLLLVKMALVRAQYLRKPRQLRAPTLEEFKALSEEEKQMWINGAMIPYRAKTHTAAELAGRVQDSVSTSSTSTE